MSESTAFFGQPKVSTKNRGATDDPTGPLSVDSRPVIDGLVEPGFEGVADALARQPRTPRRRRRGVLRLRRRPAGRRHLGRDRRRRDRPPVGRRHARARLLHHEGRDRDLRQPAHRARRARPRRCPSPTYWPEFAANGKERHPAARGALAPRRAAGRRRRLHARGGARAGTRSSSSWRRRRRAGTGTSPRPATTCAPTAGSTGEIVRRVTGRTIGRFFADEVAAPLGLDWWIGLPGVRGAARRDAAAAAAARGSRRSAS